MNICYWKTNYMKFYVIVEMKNEANFIFFL